MGTPLKKSFVLFCAGEDSGDILGEPLVETAVRAGLVACGSGGNRMVASGLRPLVDFEHLPVSGFGDVLCNGRTLRADFEKMRMALLNENCIALVAIDYPGFNMKLAKLAKRLHKPVLYVAPPQIWAWKSNRAKQLRGIPLAVFFDFEMAAYRKFGCNVRLMRHPLMDAGVVANDVGASANRAADEVILLPGSRRAQAFRNLEAFLKTAVEAVPQNGRVTVFAVRESLVKPFTEIVSRVIPDSCGKVVVEKASESVNERLARYAKASLALVCPGTATLEVSLSGCPMVICTKPDVLTYVLGKLLVRSRVLGLPNLVLGEKKFDELVVPPFASEKSWRSALAELCKKAKETPATNVAESLRSKLSGGVPARDLMLEFLGEFVKG